MKIVQKRDSLCFFCFFFLIIELNWITLICIICVANLMIVYVKIMPSGFVKTWLNSGSFFSNVFFSSIELMWAKLINIVKIDIYVVSIKLIPRYRSLCIQYTHEGNVYFEKKRDFFATWLHKVLECPLKKLYSTLLVIQIFKKICLNKISTRMKIGNAVR